MFQACVQNAKFYQPAFRDQLIIKQILDYDDVGEVRASIHLYNQSTSPPKFSYHEAKVELTTNAMHSKFKVYLCPTAMKK